MLDANRPLQSIIHLEHIENADLIKEAKKKTWLASSFDNTTEQFDNLTNGVGVHRVSCV